MSAVSVRTARGTLVFDAPGRIPPAMIRASDTQMLRVAITRLPLDKAAMAKLRANWHRLSPGTHIRSMSDVDLMNQMTRLLTARRLLIVYLPDYAGSFNVAKINAAAGPTNWARADKSDKVAEALRRSKNHVGPALAAMVEELVSPANIAIMVGFIVAVAVAHATGIAGAALDVILIGLAWAMAGYAGVQAVIKFIGAIIDVMDASSERDIDAAARVFAEAFVALGAAFLARMLAKAKTNARGQTAPKPKVEPKPVAKPASRPNSSTTRTSAATATQATTVGRTVYRGDGRSPQTIFGQGFQPKGTSTDLKTYVDQNSPSAYVGTSKSSAVATDFAAGQPRGGYVYQIDGSKLKGVDVNAAYPANRFASEQEIAVLGGIPSSAIVSARPVSSSGQLGAVIPNPFYKGP